MCFLDIVIIIFIKTISNSFKILKTTLSLLNVQAYLFYTKALLIIKYFKFLLDYNLFILVKLFCLTVLLKSGFDVTFDYLGFPFEYKLIVLDNKYGFDFPSISVCTENNVLFDKQKIIEHFDLQKQWNQFGNNLMEELQQNINSCNQKINIYYEKRLIELNESEPYNDLDSNIDSIKDEFKLTFKCYPHLTVSNSFVSNINGMIFDESNFYEMNSLTINTNKLFDCSAKVHFRTESFDSNAHKIDNCFKYFDALKSIYSNEDFGICFEFFAKNYSIYLKDDDYIELNVKYSEQKNIFVNAFQEMYYLFSTYNYKQIEPNSQEIKTSLKYFLQKYFGLYFFVDPKTRLIPHIKNIAFKSTRNSMNAELRITKSSVKLLSKPYMNKCINYGKFSLL